MTGAVAAAIGNEHNSVSADAATRVRDDGLIVNDRFMVCPFLG
jgi:hypothetical protein